MRRQIIVVLTAAVLLGTSVVPAMWAEAAPVPDAISFLSAAPQGAPMSPAAPTPDAGALFLAKPGGGGPTSCEISPLCTNPPPGSFKTGGVPGEVALPESRPLSAL